MLMHFDSGSWPWLQGFSASTPDSPTPDSPTDESPTIWLHEETGDLLFQSYRATAAEVNDCKEVGSVPGHATDVPDNETIIRLPAAMLDYLPARREGDRGGEAEHAASSA